MASTWVVVADTSRARIFSAEKPAGDLVEIEDLTHPEARLHEGDLTTDRAGSGKNGGTVSFALGDTTSHKEAEATRFAHEVSERVEAGRVGGKFHKLYVIAAPQFLGLLRKHQSSATRQLVAAEISKNLSSQDSRAIRAHLPDYL
jgi:protein required for attachment to host cells